MSHTNNFSFSSHEVYISFFLLKWQNVNAFTQMMITRWQTKLFLVAGSPASIDGVLNEVLSLPEVPRKQYRLSPNPAENQQLKSEFYYEQVWFSTELLLDFKGMTVKEISCISTYISLKWSICVLKAPSASLCVAILTLHSDHAACGQQLIGHCRLLSRKLTNPEVDARLLTDVMRQLLFSAKLMFVNAGCTQEPALCDRLDTHTFTWVIWM